MQKLVSALISILLLPFMGSGQHFQFRADLPVVDSSGFFKIALTPALVSHLKTDLSDIRLYDGQHREVPYIITREQPAQTRQLFREYQVIRHSSVPGSATTLVLRNPGRHKINNISLLIKNTNVRKKARLSGSNDGQHWYSLEDSYYLHSLYSQAATAEVNLLHFPLSDYEYYELILNDSTSAPLNILKAGYYDTYSETGKYTMLPTLPFTQTDSSELKQTFIFFKNKTPVHADKITLRLNGSPYYLRQATLYQAHFRKKRRRKLYKTYEPVATFQLQSNQENTFTLNHFKSNDFYLGVNNQDNPPLQLKQIYFYYLNTYLVASLQKRQAYTLAFGDEEARLPEYDLAYFKDSIPPEVPLLVPVNPTLLAPPQAQATPTLFRNKNVIWVAIILVIGLLSFMTYRMLQETGKKPE